MRISRDDRRAWWTALLLLCTVLIAPLLLVDVPPLLDYPNHLARMVLLAWPDDPTLSRFAAPHWAIIPDLAIDLVVPPLLHVLPVHVAGRIVVGGIVLLQVLGAIAYSHAAFGKRSWWALAVGLIAYSETVLLGFLNFTAGIGLALLLAAAWIRWRDTRPGRTAVLAALGAIVVFFCHLMGLVFLAVMLSAFEAARVGARLPRYLCMPCAALPSLPECSCRPLLSMQFHQLSHVAGETEFLSLHDKVLLLLVPFVNYRLTLDSITAAAVALFLTYILVTRRCRAGRRLRYRHSDSLVAVCRRARRRQGRAEHRCALCHHVRAAAVRRRPATALATRSGSRRRHQSHRFVRGAHGRRGHGLARQCHRHR